MTPLGHREVALPVADLEKSQVSTPGPGTLQVLELGAWSQTDPVPVLGLSLSFNPLLCRGDDGHMCLPG